MPDRDAIRTHVADAYRTAVTTNKGCCGEKTKGVAAQWAGYTDADTAGLPEEALTNSFGCGNPLAFSEVQPGDTVLDLGSGAGIDLLLAARKVGPDGKVIGVDMTWEMIDKARENLREAGLENVQVKFGFIEELPVEDASVDWVISNCVINLSPEKDKVFREIHRVLKPGGRMRVSDLVVEELPEWVREDQGLYNTCIGGAISYDDYVAGLRDAGLKNIEILDKLEYDESQIRALITSETGSDEGCGCGCSGEMSVNTHEIERAATQLAGKVWSVAISAQK